MIRVGIVGAAGYTAGELIRLLLNHPEAEIVFAHSESNAGNLVADVHEGLLGETTLRFTDRLVTDEIDALFLCMGHGKSRQFLAANYVPPAVAVIDLAQDFRIASQEHDFVYGLPELNRVQLLGAHHVANPGCFATCIQLALLPLAEQGLLQGDILVNAITGATGAGVKPAATTHFAWRANNVSVYKAFEHQHVGEIVQSLRQLQDTWSGQLDFIPWRGDFARGIFATVVCRQNMPEEEIANLYKEFYQDAAFTHYADNPIDLKQVVNTNKALVHCCRHDDKLLVTSAIDNLLKGASGQAVQNFNLMFALEETAGLRLKPSAF